ncbi:hypothetical protein ACB094_11G137200 [Castanea mollissima]
MLSSIIFVLVSLCFFLLVHGDGFTSIDYAEALNKSLLYYEAQRSGELPIHQRVEWRAYSALSDGREAGVDLEGGYYNAGDNVKFGFPLAFTITMLSWSTIEFQAQLKDNNQLTYALEAIQWGTDYLIKAHPEPHVLYGQVGDGDSDHACWQRPEDMTTPLGEKKEKEKEKCGNGSAEIVGEKKKEGKCIRFFLFRLWPFDLFPYLKLSDMLFEFASNYSGLYQNSITSAAKFYNSSYDELLWAAVWLYRATNEDVYLDFVDESSGPGGPRSIFYWDDKYVGVQVLIAKNNVQQTPGGLLWFLSYNLQYVTTAAFVAAAYSEYLTTNLATFDCPGGTIKPNDLLLLAKSQVDYILGSNPRSTSYMVGLGPNYPTQVHHRGASIVSIKVNPAPVSCKGGYDLYYGDDVPNPNLLEGAVVYGPDENDIYSDLRSNYQQAAPATVTPAPLVGILAKLALTFT